MALAVMPFQGLAEAVAAMLCHSEMGAHSVQVEPHHPGNGTAVHDHEHANKASPDGALDNHTDDPCCHLAISGLPVSGVLLPTSEFPVLASARDPLQSSVFLELPQRPPLV